MIFIWRLVDVFTPSHQKSFFNYFVEGQFHCIHQLSPGLIQYKCNYCYLIAFWSIFFVDFLSRVKKNGEQVASEWRGGLRALGSALPAPFPAAPSIHIHNLLRGRLRGVEVAYESLTGHAHLVCDWSIADADDHHQPDKPRIRKTSQR